MQFPAQDSRVSGGDVTFRGVVRDPDRDGEDRSHVTRVQYVVDVSGSTSSPVQDCNGDGVRDVHDDFNGDGRHGDVLDCQISAVVALNADLRGIPGAADGIEVGLTAFGDRAAVAQMARARPDLRFVPPGATDDDKDVIPNLNFVASSLREGRLGEYASHSVGTGTNFDAALGAALGAFGTHTGPKWVFFLSDGQATVSESTLTRISASGAAVRTFAVGGGTGAEPCAPAAPLGRIAAAGGDACVRVLDPAALTGSVVDSQPAWLRAVTVAVGGRTVTADVDALGGWSVTVPGLAHGAHRAVVTATLADGRTATSIVTFRVADHIAYTALGDSFASGEGIPPYLDGPQDDLCHRSGEAWPRLVTLPDRSRPLAGRPDVEMRFLACSGARIVNLDTTGQDKARWWSTGSFTMPLQLDLLPPDADLVTLSIGGNDLGFAPVVTHCFFREPCQETRFITTASGTPVSLEDWMTIRLALISNELTGVYQAVRNRISPDATVLVTTYPRLVTAEAAPPNLTCGPLLLAPRERRWIRQQVDAFAAIVHDRARRPGVDALVADVRDDFECRNVCDRDAHILGPEFPRPTDLELGLSAASFHPTARGARLYAAAVDEVVSTVADRFVATSAAPASATTTAFRHSPSAPDARRVGTGSPEFRPAAATSPVPSVARAELDPVGDPDGVLEHFPDDVVSAVGSTGFAEVFLMNGAGMDGQATCDDVVTGERMPLYAAEFAPGSTVTVTTRTIDGAGLEHSTSTTEHRADDDGALRTEVVAPAAPGSGMLALTLEGTGPGGGPTIGFDVASTSDDPDCVAIVDAAGRIATEPVEEVPVVAPTPSPVAADPGASTDAPADDLAAPAAVADDDGLSLTGPGVVGACLAAAALGLIGAGLTQVHRARTARRDRSRG